MNTADYLLIAKAETASKPVLINGDQAYSYEALQHAAAMLLHGLQHAGVQPSDRIGILGANSLFWVASYLAILKLGAVAVPLATVASPEDWRRNQTFVQCRAICVEQKLKGKLQHMVLSDVALLDESSLTQTSSKVWPEPDPTFDLDRDAAIMFTSGTTARPRAVRVTHRNLQANTESIIADLGLTSDERMLVVLPFYYCFGLSLLHTHLRMGGSLALCNSFAFPETALDMIERLSCTGFAGVPSTFQTLLRNSSFARRNFKTLRKIQQAGGKLPVALVDELIAATPGAVVHIMYGQTEATARLSSLLPEWLNTKRGSIGKGIPGVQLRVMNEAGDDVQPGETGEIIARGASISPGYWNDAEATVQKFIGGALHTGDLATVDADGFIIIVDRKTDFIKSFGHRVSSQQIEACVLELVDVVSAAAIGVPDDARGEAIILFITLRTGGAMQLLTDQIAAHCAQRLPRHMLPRNVILLDALPLNPNGKVIKAELKKQCVALLAA